MKIITEPTVTLVSVPQFIPHPVYELPPHEVDQEKIVAMAGKVCYDSYGIDGNSVWKHVRNLVDSGHHSVLEHVHVGVFIEGISRGCSHEIVRHRMFNYSQRSTRYTEEGDAAIVLDPYFASLYTEADMASHLDGYLPAERTALKARGVDLDALEMVYTFLSACEESLTSYSWMVQALEALNPEQLAGKDLRKWCRGKARQLLPHALETRMVMTGNLRAWRHFFLMRTSRHAEAEIRRLAERIFQLISPIAPTVFDDMSAEIVNGFLEVKEAA